MIDSFNPPDVWPPFGPFSMAVVQRDGRIVHLKGQVSLDQTGRIVGRGDMHAQTRKVLENIQTLLASFGGRMQDIVSLTQYVTDFDAFIETRALRREFFAPPFPVTTTVQVVRLYDPALLVEITAIAEIPRERFRQPFVPRVGGAFSGSGRSRARLVFLARRSARGAGRGRGSRPGRAAGPG